MTANTKEDYDLKFKLLNDTLDIVDMEGRLSGKEKRIGGFDLIYRGERVDPAKNSVHSTMLGALEAAAHAAHSSCPPVPPSLSPFLLSFPSFHALLLSSSMQVLILTRP